jgi:hypothetical protein
MYTALQLIKDELKTARETLEGTMADVKEEYVNKDPGGKALPVGAAYAHLIFSEDSIVQGMLQQKAPLSETTWKGKTGASEPMPPMDENWSSANEKWSKTVKIDLAKIKEYAQAVYKETDEYVNSLADADLEKEVDLGSWGKKTIAYMLYSFITGHTNSLTGEISAIKGVFGAKGYPF